MRVARTVEAVRAEVGAARRAGRSVALVPTMGALHEGHLSLVRRAREWAAEIAPDPMVVVSVYVNPTQFGPNEDFDAYPRTLDRDTELAVGAGAELVFAPTDSEMYPAGFQTMVRVRRLAEGLCGGTRPGHFDGVAVVVTKLLNIVRPDLSVFGRKDAQQGLLIQRLAKDLNLPGEVRLAETVREPDGLAMSSRNAYLGADERKAAAAISRGLFAARSAYDAGEREPAMLIERARRALAAEPLLDPEYVELYDVETWEAWSGSGPALLAVAVRAPSARLIDNVFLGEGVGAGSDASSSDKTVG